MSQGHANAYLEALEKAERLKEIEQAVASPPCSPKGTPFFGEHRVARRFPLWRDLLSQAEAVASRLDALCASRLVIVVDRKNTLDRPWGPSPRGGLLALFAELAECFPHAQEVEVYALSAVGRERVLRIFGGDAWRWKR